MDNSFRLHHIGILVADIAATSEQFAKRFGYSIDSPIIEDARQTAFVQFLRLGKADHWTELVSPNGDKSVLRGALERRKGGVHHLCYEVDDIDAACKILRGQAMAMVSAPVPAVAFDGRRIAWFLDRDQFLVELVEAGPGRLSLSSLAG
ncbi:MAG TPA: VOC family protein [Gemmatimonadaceae bacterium]